MEKKVKQAVVTVSASEAMPVPVAVEVIPAPKVRKTKKPGRKPKARAERIRELTRAGFTPKQIREKVGGTIEYVYVVRTAMRAADKKKRKPVLPFTPAPVKREGTSVPFDPYASFIHRAEPRPTLWQRIKAVFTG